MEGQKHDRLQRHRQAPRSGGQPARHREQTHAGGSESGPDGPRRNAGRGVTTDASAGRQTPQQARSRSVSSAAALVQELQAASVAEPDVCSWGGGGGLVGSHTRVVRTAVHDTPVACYVSQLASEDRVFLD